MSGIFKNYLNMYFDRIEYHYDKAVKKVGYSTYTSFLLFTHKTFSISITNTELIPTYI